MQPSSSTPPAPVARRLRLGVLFGGRSGEHEVSLMSAESILAALDHDRYEIVPIGIARDGRWLFGGDPLELLRRGGPIPAGAPLWPRPEDLAGLDVIFPVLHGTFGEDGTVQGFLDLTGIPYVGCGVLASALAMDKAVSKQLFAAIGLPLTPWLVVYRHEWERQPGPILARIEGQLDYPLFIKPANLGSSVGITKARDRADLQAGLDEAALYDRKMIVEQAVPHAREIEVSVLGNEEPVVSIPGEIVPSNEFYDYAAKYLDGASIERIPAPITAEQTAQVQDMALRAFCAVDASGLSRVDFLLDDESGRVYINELNTIPGFTSISMYPKLWEASGMPYGQLLDRLIELALERHHQRSRNRTSYAPPRG
ncbi:MAG: D-alanine--D-alanine ligase [Caldilineae bacterium]|nr:MAG: D-alanine--D-alanine ligase [Caldilineae bacterium]